MRSKRIPVEEQYRLIMECRQSGLTDHQWCVEHDIKPGTFYNWVRRLRQKGYANHIFKVTGYLGRTGKTAHRSAFVSVNSAPKFLHAF